MLHSEPPQQARLHATFTGPSGDEAGVGELVTFALGFLRRNYMSIIFTTMLALALCIVYLSITPPTYTAQARVLLENRKAQFVQEQSLLAEQIFDVSQIETQLEIIKSRSIALAVIKQLNLADDPDLNRSTLSFWEGIRAPFSQPTKQPRSAAVEQPSEAMIGAFLDRLQASRVGSSNIIEISFSSSSAGRSAMIANAVADNYAKDQVNAKAESSRNATAWLQDRLRDLSSQALVAERAVNTYKAEHNIVVSGGNHIDEQQIADLSSRLVASRARTSDVLAQLNHYKAILRADTGGSPSVGSPDATGSDALNNPIINNLRQQYLEVGRRKSEYSARFGSNHLAVLDLQRRMQSLRASMLDEVRRLAETSQSDYLVAKQRQQEIEKQLDAAVSMSRTTNSAEVALGELESRAKTYRSLHDTLLQRYMGAVQQETFPISEVRLISPALTPEGKSKPKTMQILALGAFGGIAVGIAVGLFRHLTDRAFRTSDNVEAALHLCCLAMVPRLRATNLPKVLPAVPQQTDADSSREKVVSTQSSIIWSTIDAPSSQYTESIRAIKLGVDLSLSNKSNKVIGVTSALPNEGKTTIAVSLAHLIGKTGKRVILVDGDFRNPWLSANLAPNAAGGIIDVIRGRRSLTETIWHHPKTNLTFLPTGRRSLFPEISEIFSADATRILFDQLRATYDYVIVDLPPLSPVVDVRAAGSLVDGFILVIEWGRTKIDVVQHALHTAPNIYENLIGTVLNKIDVSSMEHFASYWNDCYSDDRYLTPPPPMQRDPI